MVGFCFVRERGLEPPRIAPSVPKTDAATITPLTHYYKPIIFEAIILLRSKQGSPVA